MAGQGDRDREAAIEFVGAVGRDVDIVDGVSDQGDGSRAFRGLETAGGRGEGRTGGGGAEADRRIIVDRGDLDEERAGGRQGSAKVGRGIARAVAAEVGDLEVDLHLRGTQGVVLQVRTIPVKGIERSVDVGAGTAKRQGDKRSGSTNVVFVGDGDIGDITKSEHAHAGTGERDRDLEEVAETVDVVEVDVVDGETGERDRAVGLETGEVSQVAAGSGDEVRAGRAREVDDRRVVYRSEIDLFGGHRGGHADVIRNLDRHGDLTAISVVVPTGDIGQRSEGGIDLGTRARKDELVARARGAGASGGGEARSRSSRNRAVAGQGDRDREGAGQELGRIAGVLIVGRYVDIVDDEAGEGNRAGVVLGSDERAGRGVVVGARGRGQGDGRGVVDRGDVDQERTGGSKGAGSVGRGVAGSVASEVGDLEVDPDLR